MAHNLTETDTYTANVSVPDGGDARLAASVETPFQALTNRAKYLYTRLIKLAGFYSDGTFQLDSLHGQALSTSWSFLATAWSSIADSEYLFFPIDASVLPHGATLTGFSARVNPGAGRATPGNRIQFEVYKITMSGTWSIVGSGTYDDGTTNLQTVTKTGLTEVINRNTYSYVLRITAGNTGAASPDAFYGAEVSRTL